MITTAFVKMWGKTVGAVSYDAVTGLAAFEYDSGFVRTGISPAPLKMPTATGIIYQFPNLASNATFKGLPGLLADVLPDKYGNALINNWLNKNGRPSYSLNPVEILCFIGKRGMGALEFEPVNPKTSAVANNIEIGALVEVAQKILSERTDMVADFNADEQKAMTDILNIGTSAGGARAKAIIAYNPATGQVKSGQAAAPAGFGHWLIKFDGVHDSQFGESSGYGRVEMAYHLMAVACGIEMTECRLLEENGRAHFMTRRFDRPNEKDKLHVQTFCAMQHYDFNDVGVYSYEQLFETMRLLALPYPQMEQLYRRMVFNVLARNCDDHTKNFAFLIDKNGEWRLSPAYDVCFAYRPGSPWVSSQSLTVNGKRTNISNADLLAVAKTVTIKKAAAIIEEVKTAVGNWGEYANQTKVAEKLWQGIEKVLKEG
jgi:serine/threonine-protein kinase HipA